jgi:hypothetical protein
MPGCTVALNNQQPAVGFHFEAVFRYGIAGRKRSNLSTTLK